jgi:sugar lactone lactonase YvrE
MIFRKIFIFLFLIIPYQFSFPQEDLFISKVLTQPGEFTSGIEGPACDKYGNIYAVNFETKGTIGRITPAGDCSLFIELPKGSIGNGIRFNSKGEMFIADYTGHNILTVDMNTKEVTFFAHEPKMNQPNDIAITSTDILFASDPNWKDSTGNIWRIDKSGNVILLESNMGTTNGIEVSPDDKILYVNESIQRNIWVYDLSSEGNISNKRLLIKFDDFGLDGMRCDVKGNLYITRYDKGTIAKVSPEGKILTEIVLTGKKPSNITFGGPERKTAYVTLADKGNIETFKIDIPGKE